jgi:hypothetical protein
LTQLSRQFTILLMTTMHTQDSDCTLSPELDCLECGVAHGAPCPCCKGRGFHAPGCTDHFADLVGEFRAEPTTCAAKAIVEAINAAPGLVARVHRATLTKVFKKAGVFEAASAKMKGAK